MDLGLRGKTALVTGASSGIGAATAELLAEEGCDVVVGYYRNLAGAEQAARSIRQSDQQAWLCQMDVSDAAQVEVAIGELPDEARPLDLLILCAGEATISAGTIKLPSC